MTVTHVAVVVGSLRRDSFNRKVANVLIGLATTSLKLEIVEIRDLPLYNQDEDVAGRIPAAWSAFRQRIKAVDAVIFVTPEYNRSVPGVLKNAIDVGSTPYGQSVWDRKPAGIVSVSPGAIGGFGAGAFIPANMQSYILAQLKATLTPDAANSRATARPIPLDPPVTIATLPFSSRAMRAGEGWV